MKIVAEESGHPELVERAIRSYKTVCSCKAAYAWKQHGIRQQLAGKVGMKARRWVPVLKSAQPGGSSFVEAIEERSTVEGKAGDVPGSSSSIGSEEPLAAGPRRSGQNKGTS